MKKLLVATAVLFFSSIGFCQTCEQRESKLLEAVGSFSAGMLYNTYGTIGSIVDGYAHDAYQAETVNSLLDAQKKLMDNLVKVLEDLKEGGFLTAKDDINYASTAITILKGLKLQAQYMLDYVKNNTQKNQDAYDAQRTKNWKDISKLMGLEG